MAAQEHPLTRGVVGGQIRALARVCRLVDDAVGDHRRILKELFPHTGHAWTVGITGTPGAGKSTLADALIVSLRKAGARVGVVAIDPSSPFSGGAILGDRIRMQRHHADAEVFIRSVATRGTLGGLSRSAADLIRVLDAWRADVVLVETVGVGQDELEVTRTVDTTVVVMAPGMGDEVQAIKAGILECADVFAVNKADRDGADATAAQLESMVALDQDRARPLVPGHGPGHLGAGASASDSKMVSDSKWATPIIRCVATQAVGIDELHQALETHREWLYGTEAGQQRRLERLREAMRNQLRNALIDTAMAQVGPQLDEAVLAVADRQLDPYTAAERLIDRFRKLR